MDLADAAEEEFTPSHCSRRERTMSQQPGGDPPLTLDPTDDDDLEPISLVYDDDDIGVADEPLASQPEDLDEADPDSDASLDLPDDALPDADPVVVHHDFEVSP
jgi:hypothetical protein